VKWLATLAAGWLLASAVAGSPRGTADAAAAGARQQELTAPGGAAADLFGRAVGLSGHTAVVGAPIHPLGSNVAQGAAYVFTQSGPAWRASGRLAASDGAAGDLFGSSVAVAGPTAVVGSPHHRVGSARLEGAVYVFTRVGGSWVQSAELTARDGRPSDEFGFSVALSGSTAVVGAPYHAVGSNIEQGAAYVFVRRGSSWTQAGELTAADGGEYDNLGTAVAVDAGTVVVGSDGHQVGANAEQGDAYVFTPDGTSWRQTAELRASDGNPEDFFGSAVAISGSTIVVGAPDHAAHGPGPEGAAYVFTGSGSAWTERARLAAAPARGARRTYFGCSVAVSGTVTIVGGDGHQVGADREQGLAYVFVRRGSSWASSGGLTASDGAPYDNLGYAVAVSGRAALVGAPGHTVGGRRAQGAAYVFGGLP